MELQEAVKTRRSIRRFLPKPVPEDIIKEIISDTLWAPSWGNTQPWEVIAVTGDAMESFKKKNKEVMLSGGKSSPDIKTPDKWPDRHNSRYKNVGKSVLGSLSIARDDSEGRLEYYSHMATCFDAPALILLTVDKELNLEYAMLDIGIFIQTFCLLAHGRGLGTCIMAISISYPEIARELFSIPDTRRLVIGAALGWPDPDAPENNFARERGSLDEFVNWSS